MHDTLKKKEEKNDLTDAAIFNHIINHSTFNIQHPTFHIHPSNEMYWRKNQKKKKPKKLTKFSLKTVHHFTMIVIIMMLSMGVLFSNPTLACIWCFIHRIWTYKRLGFVSPHVLVCISACICMFMSQWFIEYICKWQLVGYVVVVPRGTITQLI